MQGQEARPRATALAGLTALVLAAVAAPAGAMSLPAPPTFTISAPGGAAVTLMRSPECNDTPPVPMPPALPVAGMAKCLPPQEAPTATLATPGSFDLRADVPVTSFHVGWSGPGATAPAPTSIEHSPQHWTVQLPSVPDGHILYAQGRHGGGAIHGSVVKIVQPPIEPPGDEPPVDGPLARALGGDVAIVRADRRGRVATVVVDATPGIVSAYLTASFRRRTAVARATVTRAGKVRLRIPLGRLSARALASAGVTVVLRPAGGGAQVRAGVRWKAAVAGR